MNTWKKGKNSAVQIIRKIGKGVGWRLENTVKFPPAYDTIYC